LTAWRLIEFSLLTSLSYIYFYFFVTLATCLHYISVSNVGLKGDNMPHVWNLQVHVEAILEAKRQVEATKDNPIQYHAAMHALMMLYATLDYYGLSQVLDIVQSTQEKKVG
jgi:hypothetical protein